VRVTDDGLFYAVDLAMVVTGKNRDDAAKSLRNLSNDIFQQEKFTYRSLSLTGGHATKLVAFQAAIELIMVLPGKVAKETRFKFSDIIKRYLAGDSSLISEIQQNAASDSPIAQMARASLDAPDQDELLSRKRQLEREDALFEMEMAERKQRLMHSAAETQAMLAETQARTVAVQKTLREDYAFLCPGQVMDDRARLMFKDNILNLATMSAAPYSPQLAIENGIPVASAPVEDTRPMTASSLALEIGKRYTTKALQRIGVIMSNLYQKKYGEKASQHEQYTDGAVRLVRSYTRRDKDLLLEAFRLYDAETGAH